MACLVLPWLFLMAVALSIVNARPFGNSRSFVTKASTAESQPSAKAIEGDMQPKRRWRRRRRSAIPNTHPRWRQPLRDVSFWSRTLRIYSSYKLRQLFTRFGKRQQRDVYNVTHELNSNRMMDLCLSMRGFYLKTGQFLATRRDFMPQTYTDKLSKLHDSVPPMSKDAVREVLERELGGPVDDFFSSIDLDKPIGAASIAQVHRAVWRQTGEKVAVKVQYPAAERLCKGDLKNLRRLAEFLQRTELKFDLLSAIIELQKQIKNEFDFIGEARNMDTIREKLLKLVPEVTLPRSIFATRRALIMTYIDGDNLSKLAEYKQREGYPLVPQFIKRRAGTKLMNILAKAWGTMIFEIREFNADPHPGNICLGGGSRGLQIGLLDWGQVKKVGDTLALDFATFILAVESRDEGAIVDSLFNLGVRVSNPSDRAMVKRIGLTMLDTGRVEGYVIDPFDPRNTLKSNSVTKMPSELYFIVRTVQLFRGICFAFDLDYSLAARWAPLARAVVKNGGARGPFAAAV